MTGAAMDIPLKHLVSDRDRHGNVRLYVRLPGKPKVRIREKPGTEEFMDAYKAALNGESKQPARARTAKLGSFRHLSVLYFGGDKFKSLDPSTQDWQRRALESICEKHGAKPVALMEPKHVRRIRNERKAEPAAANHRMKAIRSMFAWANEEEEVDNNPTLGVKNLSYVTNGYHTWTREEIEQYKERHPLGTRARLALDLLRFTTGRREDAPRLGRQHLKNGRLKFRQAKNEHRAPIDIDIPAHPELLAGIEATPSGHLTFLTTSYGRPYTTAGFGNAMRDWCDQANLRHCSAHGLRKATPTMMAENSATPHELMSVTGHQTLEQVEVYTRAANRARLADSAMAKLK